MLGYSPSELPQTHTTWEKLVHPDDKEPAYRVLKKSMNRDVSWNIEFRLQTKNGDYKWILGRGKVVEKNREGEHSQGFWNTSGHF